MTNFIAVRYTFPTSGGAVLINVNHIKSIDMNNGKIYISVTDQKFQYPIDHTFEEIRQMIDQSGAVIIEPAKRNEVIDLFERLKIKYPTLRDISRVLKQKYPNFYSSDHLNAIDQRLKRLQENHDNLDSYPQKKTVLEHLKQLDNEVSNQSWNPILYTEINYDELMIRTANCFQNANIRYFWQLVKYSEEQLLRGVKNFGRKSLNEVRELLAENNLYLGMDLTGFDPDPVIH